MRIKSLLTIAFAFLFAFTALAQEKEEVKKENKSVFSLYGEYRTRFESTPSLMGRNQIVPDGYAGSLTLGQRARITAYYDNNKFETKFSFQDVRMFGQNKLDAPTNVNTGSSIWSSTNGTGLAVHEAWGMYKFLNKDGHVLGLKVGRQELALDARVIWNKNWLHQAAAYDAVKLQCRNKNLGLNWDLGFSLNSVDMPGAASPFRTLGFFKATKTLGKSIIINVVDLYEGMEGENEVVNFVQDSTFSRNTLGINPIIKFAGVTFDAGYYMQTGTKKGLVNKYKTSMFNVNLAYNIAKKYNVGLGYDNYSGRAWDDVSDPTIDKVFIAPYHGAHKYFGNTDVQLKLFGKGYGITDINFKASAKLMKTTSIAFQFHKIDFANNATNDGGTTTFKDVGSNIDFVLTHKFDKKVFVNLGYSLFMPSDNYTTMTLGAGANAKMHNFIWVMFTFKPNFLNITK